MQGGSRMLCLAAQGLVSPCPSGAVGSFFLPCSGREWTSELLSPQMFLLASSSATQKSQSKGIYLFFTGEQPHFFFGFFLINMQVLSAQGTIQERFQPPPVSLVPFSWLHYLIFIYFFFLILHKKNGPQLLAPLSWTVSSSPSSSHGGLYASTAPGQYSCFRATLLQTLEPSPSCIYAFVQVPGCLGLDFFFPLNLI